MAAQVARGWVLVVGARSPGGSSGLPLLECSVGALYRCWAAGSLTERAGGDLGRIALPVRILLLAVLLSRENAKRLGI